MSDPVASELKTEAVGILSHLIEMRDRLLRAIILIGISFVCLFPFAKNIYNWLAAPLVDQGQEMLIIGPVAPFLIPMKLTLMVAFLIALPYLFYQLWSFVAPGLYKHEKRLIYPLIASSIFLFYLGIAFVYYILLPMMFKIIPQFAPEVATFSPDIAQYLDFTIMMFMAFGLGFEMPIATILLISTGMTTAEELKKKRPYVIVGAFIAGMLLTPPDVISQIMLAIPMWLLFEIGLIFSQFFKVRIKEASDARKDMDNNKSAATSAAVVSQAPVLSADTLWDEDSDDYANRTIHHEYQDSDTFDMGFHDDDDFVELSDEELEKIDAENKAEAEALQEKKNKAKADAKKTEAKKAATKKAAAKKAPIKKAATKKASTTPKTKSTAKKTTVKKTPIKKPMTKKAAVKKTAATKTPVKKTPVKKSVTKKAAPKSATTTKKTPAKKPAEKKPKDS